ncbi:Acetyltransferase GNAT family [Methanonatronarchaeum thermophilum]|uniref:Acetyltransferase GNAT family n=1 Tax=Methanonatronarchaeum thermophilum TaxID=1927129 RepID=A0A1Y3GFK0_9EURY|nr:GNAT family N-acetyltransferase [Methanonatronarchaeum thermophilum]OUJ18235.1 Acetyltransferase GNAT family [Methanonatronarchaeum thermophilum]
MSGKIQIRRATRDDLSFIAWVMCAATRGHLQEGSSDCRLSNLLEKNSIDDITDFFKHLATTDQIHYGHISKFWVAEYEGEMAGAMSSFSLKECDEDMFKEAVNTVIDNLKTQKNIEGLEDWLSKFDLDYPEGDQEAWGIEMVAVLPEFRGLGITDHLFQRIFHEAREEGYNKVQIGYIIGNKAAEKAYKRNGFSVTGEYKDPEYAKLMGSPGFKIMVKKLN